MDGRLTSPHWLSRVRASRLDVQGWNSAGYPPRKSCNIESCVTCTRILRHLTAILSYPKLPKVRDIHGHGSTESSRGKKVGLTRSRGIQCVNVWCYARYCVLVPFPWHRATCRRLAALPWGECHIRPGLFKVSQPCLLRNFICGVAIGRANLQLYFCYLAIFTKKALCAWGRLS